MKDRTAYYKEYERTFRKKKTRPRLTLEPSESAVLKKLAKQHKRSLATQIKLMALAYAKNKTLLTRDIESRLDKINFLLNNIGNNINQIAQAQNVKALQVNSPLDVQKTIQLHEAILDGIEGARKQIDEFLYNPEESPS